MKIPDLNRRGVMIAAGLTAGAAALATNAAQAAPAHATSAPHGQSYPPGRPGIDYQPVIAPNGVKIPFTVSDGVKIFHLTLGEYDHTCAQGLVARVWGFNPAAASAIREA